MARTLSKSARAEKTKEIRDQFPELEQRLDAFRDNDFNAENVMDIIRFERAGGELKGNLSEKYSGLEDEQKERVTSAVNDILEGYSEFFESRRRNGVTTKAADAFEALEGDIGKICNFNNGSPYHKARQGIENHLLGREQELDSPTASSDPIDEPKREDPAVRTADHMRGDAQKLAAVAGTAAGIAAGAEAAKNWRDRVKNPEKRKKALAFAGAAAVSLGAVALSVTMSRGGLGEIAAKLSSNRTER